MGFLKRGVEVPILFLWAQGFSDKKQDSILSWACLGSRLITAAKRFSVDKNLKRFALDLAAVQLEWVVASLGHLQHTIDSDAVVKN